MGEDVIDKKLAEKITPQDGRVGGVTAYQKWRTKVDDPLNQREPPAQPVEDPQAKRVMKHVHDLGFKPL